MNASSIKRRLTSKHHKAFVAATERVVVAVALVVCLGGVRLLLDRLMLWLAISAEFVRRALGYP